MSRREGDFQLMLEQTRQRVYRTRRLYYAETVESDGGISHDLHLELAKRVLEYDDILSEFKTADGVDPSDFPDISDVKSRLGKRTEVVAPSPRRGLDQTTTERPAIVEVPANDLVRMTKQLDQIAQQLGFGAEADAEPPAGPHGGDRWQ